jgi:hypothetical protein
MFHISPVKEINNGVIKTGDGKQVPIILIGEHHDVTREKINEYMNTHSLLDIIEKYVLYNLTNRDARIVIHIESSFVKSIDIEDYFQKNYDSLSDIKKNLNDVYMSYKELNMSFDYLKPYINMQDMYTILDTISYNIDIINNDINKYEVLFTRYENINNIKSAFTRLTLLLEKMLNEVSESIYDKLESRLSKQIRHLSRIVDDYGYITNLVKNIAKNIYSDEYSSKQRFNLLSQLNLIYAGGWLKSAFKESSAYLPHKDISYHLQLVGTITSITDNVEIYNIDYRTIIIDNLKSKLDILTFEHSYKHYEDVYDLVINKKILTYYDSNDNIHTIDNPINKIYDKLNIATFKEKFITSIIDIDKTRSKSIDGYRIDYYWILDLCSVLQFIKMCMHDTPPSMFITILGNHHRKLQYHFLRTWYDNNYVDYSLETDKNIEEYKLRDSAYLTNCISTYLFTVNAASGIDVYLNNTLEYGSNTRVEYRTYEKSLNSYEFFIDYPMRFTKNETIHGDNFILDIVNNFSNIFDSKTTLQSYNQEQKTALLQYFENTTSLFTATTSLFNATTSQKIVGGGSKQDDILYQIQADFAKYYMHICGYDDPIKLITATKRVLSDIDKIQTLLANPVMSKVSAIGYPTSFESRVIKKSRIDPSLDSHKDSLYGGGLYFILRVLLISATLVALILLLCWMFANWSMHAVEQSSRRYSYDYLLDNNYLI